MYSAKYLYSTLFLLFALAITPLLAQQQKVPFKFIEWPSNNGSKPYAGYVEFGDGNRLDGTLEIRAKKGYISSYKLNAEGKEYEFKPKEIKAYGYYFKPDYFSTKNKAPAQIFQPGSITSLDGEVRLGYVAFEDELIIGKDLPRYQNILFAPSLTDTVSYLLSPDVGTVKQTINGRDLTYRLQAKGFVNTDALTASRTFLPGKVELKDGSTLTGQICPRWFGAFIAGGIYLKDGTGEINRIDAEAITTFSVTKAGQEIPYLRVRDGFVAQERDLGTHLMLRNPFPTRINKLWSAMGDGANVVGNEEVITPEIVATVSSPEVLPPGFNDVLKHASGKQLFDMEEAIALEIVALGQGPETKAKRQRLAERRTIIRTVAERRQDLEYGMGTYQRSIYKKEWLLRNKATGADTPLVKANLMDSIEAALSACHAYLVMSPKDKKRLADWDNLGQIAALLSGCR
ncbi:hypothetical protein [Neolewinella persica]|uniref:hypothetical protein n=1 Tax=Neolewinella persica TaxID=70998 RepID=UPI00035C96E6|nr:hypothetical protein [Neolewinella persica]